VKYVVLGAYGQLGRDLCPRLPGEVVPLARPQVDLARPETLRPAMIALRPDVVVNCAAYNFVDRAEAEQDAAFTVNAWGVRALAEVCRDLDCLLVHFSSDYVFGLDAGRHTPYAPADAPGPLGVYGLSKLAGEYLVRSLTPRHLIVRTCGLYGVWGVGGKGGNFIETMLRLAGEGKPLRVVNDQECTPSYTVDVAWATAALLQKGTYGLHHVTNAGSCTWYTLARAVLELAGVRADLQPIASTEWKSAARRPAYSVLGGGPVLRTWREAVTAYLEERNQRRIG
jgi:dTDP-4-dehydrorhamnose reductase